MKWTADRSEAFISDAHGRDHVTKAELALDADGNFLAMRVNTKANIGAYMSTFSSCVPTYLYGTLLAGQYKTPAIYCNVQAYYTNTVPVDANRGAGRRRPLPGRALVDQAAREIGIDPAELRRQNFIPTNAFPYQTPVALTYDTGDYQRTLDEALRLADYAGCRHARPFPSAGASCAASASPATSRLAAWPRRPWSAPWAAVLGYGRAARFGSPIPARCR